MEPLQQADGRDRVRTIDAELLVQAIRSGRRVLIVDVRDSAAFRGPSGRITGALSIPLYQLRARCKELAAHMTDLVVVVSSRGHRSRLAALELEFAGFTEVQSLDGGIHRWIELGLPVTHAPAGRAVAGDAGGGSFDLARRP